MLIVVLRSIHSVRRPLGAALGTALLLAVGVTFMARHVSEWDHVFLGGARHLARGEELFFPADGYLYPPFMAWIVIPFTWIPPAAARLAWLLVNIGSLAVTWRCAWRVSGGGTTAGWRDRLIAAAGIACAARYALNTLAHQQVDLVIAA